MVLTVPQSLEKQQRCAVTKQIFFSRFKSIILWHVCVNWSPYPWSFQTRNKEEHTSFPKIPWLGVKERKKRRRRKEEKKGSFLLKDRILLQRRRAVGLMFWYIKGSKKRYLLRQMTPPANFRCNPLFEATTRHLNTTCELNGLKKNVELGHLSAFGWPMLFSCPVLGRLLID